MVPRVRGLQVATNLRHKYTITGDHSKEDYIFFVKIGKYKGFCVYRRSYLLR